MSPGFKKHHPKDARRSMPKYVRRRQVDGVLDDWVENLRSLRGRFAEAAVIYPDLFTGSLWFWAHQPPEDGQRNRMLESVLRKGECLAMTECETDGLVYYVSLFGSAKSEALPHYKALARSAFGNLLLRPADEFLPAVTGREGEPWALWTVSLHEHAACRPSADLDCFQKGYVSSNLTWESMMMMSCSPRDSDIPFGKWEPPDILPLGEVPAHHSRLLQGVFSASAVMTDYLLRAADVTRGGPPLHNHFPIPPSAWNQVRIRVLDLDSVSITVDDVTKVYNYAQMGMVDQRRGRPDMQWELLRSFAAGRGYLTWTDSAAAPENQKRKERLSAKLQRFFGLVDHPFEACNGGWKTRFHVEEAP